MMIIVILVSSIIFNFSSCANLKMLQMIWRHGDRAPGELPYPNDVYNETFWPRGWDQLTNRGIWQAAEFGIWLRQYYNSSGFLTQFDKDQVYILSSDSERAIDTAQAVLSGVYPPTGNYIWESSFLKYWQPTPIHTPGDNPDPLLRPTKIKCPNYDKIAEEEEAPVAAQINTEYATLFKFLQNVTGIETIDYDNINDLYDIQREIDHNMPQPKWVMQVYNGTTIMDHIRELKRITRTQQFNSAAKAKFRGGYLVNQFIQNMLDFNANVSTTNTVLYSSHDGTLSALGYALNISDNQLVPYMATYIVELYDDNTVQVLYRNTTSSPYPLTIPGCQQFCPIDQFVQLLNDTRVGSLDELYEICGTNDSTTTTLTPLVTVAA